MIGSCVICSRDDPLQVMNDHVCRSCFDSWQHGVRWFATIHLVSDHPLGLWIPGYANAARIVRLEVAIPHIPIDALN